MHNYSIADHVSDGLPVQVAGSASLMPEGGVALIKSAELVRADAVAEWYYRDTEIANWSVGGSQYGPLRLPYPRLWVEWDAPAEYFADGRQGRNPTLAGACLVTEIDRDEAKEMVESQGGSFAGWLFAAQYVLCQAFIRYRSSPGAVMFLGHVVFAVSESGEVDGERFYRFVPGHPQAAAVIGQGLGEHVRPALLALGLMNCRNVQVSKPASPPRYGKRKPTRLPKLSFRTIHLPAPAGASGEDKRAAVGGVMPFHLVRGHFKTYTTDAPLMGRFTGTYWWGSQARGKKSNGIVTKDYAVSK